jgi:hypothetical protein
METEPASPDSLSPLLTNKDPEPLTDLPLATLNEPELKALSADLTDTSPDACAELAPLRMLTEPPRKEAPCPAAIETSEPAAPEPDERLNMPPRNESELEPTDKARSPEAPCVASPVEIWTKSLDAPALLPMVTDPLRPLTLPPLINSTLPPADAEVEDPPRTKTLPPILPEEPPLTDTSPPVLAADSPPDTNTAPPTEEEAPTPAEISTKPAEPETP